jgi:hypothetical protein
MADIAAADVTYVLVKQSIGESGYKNNVLTLAFGDGALTYPADGVPLAAGKLGCPNQIISLNLFGPASANGFVYKYDAANNKIRIYQGDNDGVADGALVELAGGSATPAAATLYAEVSGW